MSAAVAGFNLKKLKGRVAHLNVREEKHGEDSVLAVDIKIKADVANKFLDELSPGLRSALFAREGEQRGETPDIEEDHLTVLRFPQLAPLKWDVSVVGGKFTLHGAKKADDLDFECHVKEAALSCKEGGTVEMTFSAAVLPTPDESGKLAAMLGKDVRVSVMPVAQPELPPTE